MSKWYVLIDGRYHITRTNIAECQCECGKRLTRGLELKTSLPPALNPVLVCSTCEERYTPGPNGGPMSLPHYLEKQNQALKCLIEDIAIGMEANDLHKSAELLRAKVKEVTSDSAS